MSELIARVAAMTGHRDRDLLAISVAELLFQSLGAQGVDLWRVLEHSSGARARLLARVRAGRPTVTADPTADVLDWPSLEDMAEVYACFRSGARWRREPAEDRGQLELIPLTAEREVVGVLEIESARPLDAAQRGLVDGILRVYRNHLALLDYGEHDTLTGLLNRRTFEEVFALRTARKSPADDPARRIELVARRRGARPGETPWLAVADIDFFKSINDRFGHVFGDEVLLLAARLMRSTFRVNDTLFRFGGEEFAVLLSPTDQEGASVAVERLRRNFEAFRFPQAERVTVSIGYCRASVAELPIATFERADEALYYAKTHGRNQSRCYETLVEEGELQPKKATEGSIELF